jgi:hypothetical protein
MNERAIPARGAVLAALALLLSGCSNRPDRLVVATWWSLEDRTKLESDFHGWLAKSSKNATLRPVWIEWRLCPGWDEFERVTLGADPPDVLLGVSIAALQRLDGRGRAQAGEPAARAAPRGGEPPGEPNFSPALPEGEPGSAAARQEPRPPRIARSDLGDSRRYLLVRSGEIGLADHNGRRSDVTPSRPKQADKATALAKQANPSRGITFDDPRVDPISRAWVASLLESAHFREGYALLVRSAGTARRIGRQSGAARGAVERGEAASSPWLIQSDLAAAPRLVEGAAIVAGTGKESLAREFLRFLAETFPGRPSVDAHLASTPAEGEPEMLLADLIGATLVDAQDELWAAWSALDRVHDPGPARKWMTEPPPWPPASIARLLARHDSDAASLLGALSLEIAPEPAVRAELMRSWLAPARVIDRAVLAEIADLADGRLASEPRFRAWLCAEWTTWARQRFRRVARLAHAQPGAVASERATGANR